MTSRELRKHYRAVRARLMGPPPEPASPDPAPAERAPDPTAAPPAPPWRAELDEFNEELRAHFAVGRKASAPRARPDDVWRLVARHFGISVAELLGHSRTHVAPRHVAIFICLRVTGEGPAAVARLLARDHTSALYAARKVRSRMAADAGFAAEVERLLAECEEQR